MHNKTQVEIVYKSTGKHNRNIPKLNAAARRGRGRVVLRQRGETRSGTQSAAAASPNRVRADPERAAARLLLSRGARHIRPYRCSHRRREGRGPCRCSGLRHCHRRRGRKRRRRRRRGVPRSVVIPHIHGGVDDEWV